jgi:cytoskeletal protein CcmA (bactofilin family)
MFGKRQRIAAGSTTVIAAGSVVEGTLRVRGMVQVDGTIEGTLIAEGHVSVGPEGRIVGEITADQLSVGGKVEGTIFARNHLHVLASGTVRGNARYTTLEVERGGIMDGSASRVEEESGVAVTNVPDNDVVELATDAAE